MEGDQFSVVLGEGRLNFDGQVENPPKHSYFFEPFIYCAKTNWRQDGKSLSVFYTSLETLVNVLYVFINIKI